MTKSDTDKLWQAIDRLAALAILVAGFGCLTVGLAMRDDNLAFSATLMLGALMCLGYSIFRALFATKH